MWFLKWFYFSLFGLVLATDSASNSLEEFLEWFDNIKNAHRNDVTLQKSQYGTGVFAISDIEENDVVLSVPLDHVLCRDTIIKTKLGSVYASIDSDEILISAFLMREFADDNSAWQPYIKSLPQNLDLPFQFSEKDLVELQVSTEIARAKSLAKSRRKTYTENSAIFQKLFEDLPSTAKVKFMKQKHYLWAITMVTSRALTIKGVKYLVPFSDMFNYAPHPTARKEEHGKLFLKYHRLTTTSSGQKVFEILSDRNTNGGLEIFEDYGDNPNHIYLQYHGFVPKVNPFNCVSLELPTGDKVRGLSYKLKYKTAQCITTSVPETVVDHFRAIASPGSGIRCLKEDDVRACLRKASNDTQAYSELLQFLQQELKSYKTSSDDDIELLESASKPILRMAIEFRLSQKLLLQEVIKYLEGKAGVTAAVNEPDESSSSSQRKKRKKLANDFPDSELESKIDDFNHWFNKHNEGLINVLKITSDPVMRLGTTTTQDLKQGEVYLEVSKKLFVSLDTVKTHAFLGPMIQRHVKENDKPRHLLFWLLHEMFVASDSFYKPYLALLPTIDQFQSPLFANETHFHALQGHVMADIIKEKRDAAIEDYHNMKSKVFEKEVTIFPKGSITRDRFLWARAILNTRMIWFNGGPNLVPLLDMINCKIPDPTEHKDHTIHKTIYDQTKSAAITKAGWSFQTDEQLFEDYGQDNHRYFQDHGFVLAHNQKCAMISLAEIIKSEKKIAEAKKTITKGKSYVCINDDDKYEPLMKSILLENHKLSNDESFYRAYQIIDKKMGTFGSLYREDKGFTKSHRLKGLERTCVFYRAFEKQIFLSALGTLKKYKDKIENAGHSEL